jgi:hypothetical protein
MSLASGARLDTYEILTPLGAGGMGESGWPKTIACNARSA